MAFLDHEAVRVDKERKKAYDDLKAELKWRSSLHDAERTIDQRLSDLNISDAGRAHEYLERQEKRIAELEERLDRYNKFFIEMRDLTPPRHSIHDKIY